MRAERADGEVRVGPVVLRDTEMHLIGGRRFWAARLTADEDQSLVDQALNVAFDELDAEYEPGMPIIGIAVVLDPAAVAARPADVLWRDTQLLYAGYRSDDHQVRVRYFTGALCIDPGPGGTSEYDPNDRERRWAESEYEVHDVRDGVVPDAAILELWQREGAVPDDLREQRLTEVRAVGTTRDGELVAVGSAYRHQHPQTRLELWESRAFVASGHRRSALARQVSGKTLELVSSEPQGASGHLVVIENEDVRARVARAVGRSIPFTFIGAKPNGSTVYVLYFPGVMAPAPVR